MSNPLLSVIIPIYNGAKWLERAVSSVTVQPAYSFMEILLIDDGSTDGSYALCDYLSSQDVSICVIHKENGGVSSARNLGIQHALGKYICFLDCDDWWENDFFTDEFAQMLLVDNSADVYQFSYQEVNTFHTLVKKYPIAEKYETFDSPAFGRYNWMPHCSFMFLKDFLIRNSLSYPISKNFEDGAFVDMAMYCAHSYQSINCVMFNYWENPASCVHTTNQMNSLLEHYKAVQQEKLFFRARGVEFGGDIAWHITSAFPKLCAELDFQTLSPFMKEYCIDVLDQRPNERYQPKLWKRIELWRRNPKKCYYYYKLTYGLLWNLKTYLIGLSSTSKAFNYLYCRYYRGFEPIDKK